MICEYGCGSISKFTLKNGKSCCSKHYSSCAAQKKKNSNGLKKSYKSGKRISGKEQYENFSNETKSKMAWSKGKNIIPNDEIFTDNSHYSTELLKQRILKDNLLKYECECGIIDRWRNKIIILDLDHIDGNNRNNQLSNLRFLCPNCHSQTETYKGRNINSGKIKISDKDLIESFKKFGNIRQALIAVGLAAKGGNYARLKKLLTRIDSNID
jgi:Zn finger protein HypA/HybF involved in hydrogenase expression